MYKTLLPIVKESYGHPSANEADFLVSLQESVRQLRRQYQTHQVKVDYGNLRIQASYLLAYYPHYVKQTEHNLRLAATQPAVKRILTQPGLEATLLGSGPMPEALAIAEFRQQEGGNRSLRAKSYDLNVHDWQPACEVTGQLIAAHAPRTRYRYSNHKLNLAQGNALERAWGDAHSSQLVMMQNCLNEIYAASNQAFQANMHHLMATMPRRSVLIFSDLNYAQTPACFQVLKSLAGNLGLRVVYDHSETVQEINAQVPLPAILRNHLLTSASGLIPKKYVRQYSLCLQK